MHAGDGDDDDGHDNDVDGDDGDGDDDDDDDGDGDGDGYDHDDDDDDNDDECAFRWAYSAKRLVCARDRRVRASKTTRCLRSPQGGGPEPLCGWEVTTSEREE